MKKNETLLQGAKNIGEYMSNVLTEDDVNKMVTDGKLTYHHRALERGYISTKFKPRAYRYSGKFGKGYVVEKHNPISNRYYIKEYYIESEE